MTPMFDALIVLFGTLAASIVGFWLQRYLKPDEQSEATRSSVRMAVGLMSTLTAIVLGMVTASAKDTYDGSNDVVTGMAVDFLTLDRILDDFGPEAHPAREKLKQGVRDRIEFMQMGEGYFDADLRAVTQGSSIERVYAAVHALKPQSGLQTDLRDRALDIIGGRVKYGSGNLAQARWFFTVRPASVPEIFKLVVGLWLGLQAFSFGLFCQRKPTVYIAIGIAALVMASATFLLLELEEPLTGFLRVPVEPLQEAEQLLAR